MGEGSRGHSDEGPSSSLLFEALVADLSGWSQIFSGSVDFSYAEMERTRQGIPCFDLDWVREALLAFEI